MKILNNCYNQYTPKNNTQNEIATTSFSDALNTATSIKLPMPNENTLFMSGTSDGYTYRLSYAKNSTNENPIMLAEGYDPSGNWYESEININDINPYNATDMQMKALAVHTGKLKDVKDMMNALPLDKKPMGLNERVDFISLFEKNIIDQKVLKQYQYANTLKNNMNSYLDFYKNNYSSSNLDNLNKQLQILKELN